MLPGTCGVQSLQGSSRLQWKSWPCFLCEMTVECAQKLKGICYLNWRRARRETLPSAKTTNLQTPSNVVRTYKHVYLAQLMTYKHVCCTQVSSAISTFPYWTIYILWKKNLLPQLNIFYGWNDAFQMRTHQYSLSGAFFWQLLSTIMVPHVQEIDGTARMKQYAARGKLCQESEKITKTFFYQTD